MLKIALTGGIGSGKSAVANLFAQLGVPIIDTDIIAREVVEPHTEGWEKLVAHFGTAILLPNQNINRSQLRETIFANTTERKWLESLLHPLIRTKMLSDINKADASYCITVIPLLTSDSHNTLFDRVLVVTASLETRIQRIMERDQINRTQAKAMIDAQITDKERLAFANDVINNNASEEELDQSVIKLNEFYLKINKAQNLT